MPHADDIPANDYSALESNYLAATGHEFVCDPYGSMRYHPPLSLSASVVIPAWKAGSTLERCLNAIAISSFNRRYPDRLEVVVIDDGSPDGTWSLLRRLEPGVRMKAIRKANARSKAQTQNTGFAFAEGDVVISCDADMLLAPFAIEEVIKRHQYGGRALLLGCYANIAADDPRIASDALIAESPLSPPLLQGDPRFNIAPAWPENVFRDTRHFKRLGGNRRLIDSEERVWTAWYAVHGAFISLLRADWRAMDGYEERFEGWGSEDAMVGVRAESLGIPIIPVYSAMGWHIAHPPRDENRWEDAQRNWNLLQRLRRERFRPRSGETIDRAARRALERFERVRGGGPRHTVTDEAVIAAYDHQLSDPLTRGDYLHALGRYEEAAAAYAAVPGAGKHAASAVVKRARSLRLAGRAGAAVALLHGAPDSLAADSGALAELALSLAAAGDVVEARHWMERARRLSPPDPVVDYVLGHDATHHRRRAGIYADQGDHDLATRDFEAALLVDAQDPMTWAARARSRAAQGLPDGRGNVRPLPVTSRIVAAGQTIPGRLLPEEAELLVAIVQRLITRREIAEPLRLIEIGAGFGRATVTMGLTLRAFGRDDAQIVAVAGPDADDGRSVSAVLRENVEIHGLSEIVSSLAADEPAPQSGCCHLILIHGHHGETSVRAGMARFAPELVDGGYLLIHDGALQTVHDELLADPGYRLVAQVQGLVALTTISVTPFPPANDGAVTPPEGLR